MDASEPVTETASTHPGTSPDDQHTSSASRWARMGRGARNGARIGFWCVTYVVGPIAAMIGVASQAIVLFNLGGGFGLTLPWLLIYAAGLYLVSAFWATLIGGVIGLIGSAFGARGQGIRAKLARPIHLRIGLRVWAWIIGVPITVALIGSLAAGIYANRETQRRLDEAVAAADLENPNWRLDDLLENRDPIPDDENSALVLAEALEPIPISWPDVPFVQPGEVRQPEPAAVKAYDQLWETPANIRFDDMTVTVLRGELEKYQDSVLLARTVADYAQGRHELVIGRTVLETPLPETQKARTGAKLLYVDAAIRAHDGDTNGAIETSLAILGIARSIGDEPTAISQLVHISIGTTAMAASKVALGKGEVDDEVLDRLQLALFDEMDLPLLYWGISGERAMLVEFIRRIADGELSAEELSSPTPLDQPDSPLRDVPTTEQLRRRSELAYALDWMNQYANISMMPASDRPRLMDEIWADLLRVRKGRFARFTSHLATLMMPDLQPLERSDARYHAELGATIIMLAAERDRRKTGRWPESIDAIDPEILAEAPLDPYCGKSYRIAAHDGKFIVYSIGRNLRDERGEFNSKTWSSGGPDDVSAAAWDVSLRNQPSLPPTNSTDK